MPNSAWGPYITEVTEFARIVLRLQGGIKYPQRAATVVLSTRLAFYIMEATAALGGLEGQQDIFNDLPYVEMQTPNIILDQCTTPVTEKLKTTSRPQIGIDERQIKELPLPRSCSE